MRRPVTGFSNYVERADSRPHFKADLKKNIEALKKAAAKKHDFRGALPVDPHCAGRAKFFQPRDGRRINVFGGPGI